MRCSTPRLLPLAPCCLHQRSAFGALSTPRRAADLGARPAPSRGSHAVAHTAAKEAGPIKCGQAVSAAPLPAYTQLVHAESRMAFFTSVPAPSQRVWLSRWALDTEATASNSASQELPASGGMGICVNSTYDSGNIEVGSPGLSVPLTGGSDSCPGVSRCGALAASRPAPPAALRRLASRVPACAAPAARATGRGARTACDLAVARRS